MEALVTLVVAGAMAREMDTLTILMVVFNKGQYHNGVSFHSS